MNKFLKFVSILISVFLLFVSSAHAGQYKVVRVYDGDTLTALEGNIEIEVSLAGIDAPEFSEKKHLPSQPFSQKSKEYLSSMVLNKNVNISSYGKDLYGRTLGVVFVDGKNINLEMVKAGLAEVYRGTLVPGFDNGPYLKAESEARNAVLGIWELRDQYFSPKDWREMYRE